MKSNSSTEHRFDSRTRDELCDIIRNQKKYIQQLQTRVRLNTPDIIQSVTVQKLTEENKVGHTSLKSFLHK